MSELKHVEINPEFLVNLKQKKVKTQKRRPVIPNLKPNELKRSLLQKIREHKLNANIKSRAASIKTALTNDMSDDKSKNLSNCNISKPNSISTPVSSNNSQLESANSKKGKLPHNNVELEDEFTASLNFLQQLSSKKNKKLKNKQNPLIVNSEFPSNSFGTTNNNMKILISEKNNAIRSIRSIIIRSIRSIRSIIANAANAANNNAANAANNNDNNDNNDNNGINDNNDNNDMSNSGCIDSYKQPPYSCLKNSNRPTYRQWCATRKNANFGNRSIFAGKRGRTVQVLIKNSDTRRKIKAEHNQLIKQSKLYEMKKYLKNHNLLKSGSYAPPEVIKKMFEQAILSGDINNINNNNAIHNFLNE